MRKQLGSKNRICREKLVSFFQIEFFQIFLHTYSSHYCFSARGNQFGRIGESKREVCYFSHIDMIKLTSVPIFQNLIKKQKKQKIVTQVKAFDNLLMLVSSKQRNWSLNFLLMIILRIHGNAVGEKRSYCEFYMLPTAYDGT